MGDVKQIRRLQTNAAFVYADAPGGVPTVQFGEHKEGGTYDLHPIVKYDGDTATLLLPSADQPGYAVGLQLDAGSAGRLGRALIGVERKITGGGDEE